MKHLLRLLALSAVALASPRAVAVPTTMTYAGVLTDDGAPVNGAVDVTFTLFDAETGGDARYSEENIGLVVVDGELVAELGANALDDELLALPELWLEVNVDGTPLEPRVRLNSVPYALRAEAAQRAQEALTLGGLVDADDVVTQAQLSALGLAGGLVAGAGVVVNAGTVSIAPGGVGSAQLATSAVTTAALADGAVTTAKLANGAVTSAKIGTGAVGASQLAGSAVTTPALADGAVTTAKILANAVDSSKIGDGTVGAADIANGAVDTTKIGANAVASAQLQANAVNSSKIVDESLTSADIDDGSIATADIADGTVTAAKIAGAVSLFQVTSPGCVDAVLSLSTSPTCLRDTSGCASGQRRSCDTNTCVAAAALETICINTRIGTILP